jgi:hypothetical protein
MLALVIAAILAQAVPSASSTPAAPAQAPQKPVRPPCISVEPSKTTWKVEDGEVVCSAKCLPRWQPTVWGNVVEVKEGIQPILSCFCCARK